jgi:hypothetical protein
VKEALRGKPRVLRHREMKCVLAKKVGYDWRNSDVISSHITLGMQSEKRAKLEEPCYQRHERYFRIGRLLWV